MKIILYKPLKSFYIGKTKFLFGNNLNHIENESIFIYVFNLVYSFLSENLEIKNILLDIYKISNEKYIIDQVNFFLIKRNIVFEVKNDLVNFINQILKDNLRNSMNNNSNIHSLDYINKNEHLIITLKFFKFTETNEVDFEHELLVIFFNLIKNRK